MICQQILMVGMGFREMVLNEALVLFEKKGIERVSLEALIEVLDISRGTLHEIARSKKELVRLSINHSLKVRQAVIDNVVESTDDPMEALLQLLQLTIEEIHSFSEAFVQDLREYYPGSWARLQLFMRMLSRDYLQPLMEQSIAVGYLQQDLRAEIMVQLLLNQIQGLLNPRLFPALEVDYQELFKMVIGYYLRGCATPQGQTQIEEFTGRTMAV